MTSDSGLAQDANGGAPPAKRARRKYPWRQEYMREFGVRPQQYDAVTSDVLLVECCFCLGFGREAPATAENAAMNKQGQPVKHRTRTRNVAHWKYPFRTDNMRSHHLQQHPQKWKEYCALLDEVKQELAVRTMASDSNDVAQLDAAGAERLRQFFVVGAAAQHEQQHAIPIATTAPVHGEIHTPPVQQFPSAQPAPVVTPSPPVAPAPIVKPSSSAQARIVTPPSTSRLKDNLPTEVSSAIVQAIKSYILFVPEGEHRDKEGGRVDEWCKPHERGLLHITLPEEQQLEQILSLFAADLTVAQAAKVASVLGKRKSNEISATTTARHAYSFIATSLQRVATIMNSSWIYSLRFTVAAPVSPTEPVALRMCVCVPFESTVHVMPIAVLALHPTQASCDRVHRAIGELLVAMDSKWQHKVLNIQLDGDVHCLPPGHANDVCGLRPLVQFVSQPVINVFNGRDVLNQAFGQAWASFNALEAQGDDNAYTAILMRFLHAARGDPEWAKRLRKESIVNRHLIWSLFLTLRPLITEIVLFPPPLPVPVPGWWWHATSVISDLVHLVVEHMLYSPPHVTAADTRAIAINIQADLKSKCRLELHPDALALDASDPRDVDGEQPLVYSFDQHARVATLTRTTDGVVLAKWAGAKMATHLRAHLRAGDKHDHNLPPMEPADIPLYEQAVGRFVLLLLVAFRRCGRQQHPGAPPRAAPPTLPLEFAQLDDADADALVDLHTRRLENAFSPAFVMQIRSEITQLRTLVASDASIRSALEKINRKATASRTQFETGWAVLPQNQFTALKVFATGLATSTDFRAKHDSVEKFTDVAFTRAEDDRTPANIGAELGSNAQLHARVLLYTLGPQDESLTSSADHHGDDMGGDEDDDDEYSSDDGCD